MPEQAASERTEQPTARRLSKARGKGNVPQSQEFTSLVMLASLIAAIAICSHPLANWATSLTREGLSCKNDIFTDSSTFINFFNVKLIDCILISLPILAAMAVGATFATLAVSGPNFAAGAIAFKFDILNPTNGLKQLFSGKSMVKLLLSILKLISLGWIVWFYLNSQLENLMNLRWAWSIDIIVVISRIILGVCIRICLVLLVLAVADIFYQKWKYIQDLKMTRQEVKQEHRDTEGSPEVKSKIRKMQLQTIMKRMLQEVPKAKVVLVNPTHIAVALKYNPPEMETPVVVAKGADHVAQKIMEIARAYGVPIIRRPELARTIFATVKIDEPIPQNLYIAIAEVLAMLHRIRQRRR
jgi:flagellar biosynthesis protein FlhB